MRLIETAGDIEEGLDALVRADRRLGPVRDLAGQVPLRRNRPGFASLAAIVVSQQVSRASAEAIHGRLTTFVDPLTAETLRAAEQEVLIRAGLSAPKRRTLTALADAILDDGLDLERLCALPAEEAVASMTAVKGVGPWTAEIYLLFSAGHADIFPAGDLALKASVAHALSLDERPDHGELARIAESWAPWRGVAARLFWAYYNRTQGRDAAPVAAAMPKDE